MSDFISSFISIQVYSLIKSLGSAIRFYDPSFLHSLFISFGDSIVSILFGPQSADIIRNGCDTKEYIVKFCSFAFLIKCYKNVHTNDMYIDKFEGNQSIQIIILLCGLQSKVQFTQLHTIEFHHRHQHFDYTYCIIIILFTMQLIALYHGSHDMGYELKMAACVFYCSGHKTAGNCHLPV